MSQTARYSIACPRCGAARTVDLYESINVRENPELRDALMANEINMVSCDCGHRFRIDKTLLYHDPARGYLILLRPTPVERAEEAEREFRRILEQLARQPGLPEAPALHLVLDRIELVERIFLLEAGLDERIIEYIKHMLYTRNWKKLDPARKRLLFDAQDSTETHLVFVVQDLQTRRLEMAIQYPREAYTALCEAFDDDQRTPHLYEFFPGPYISARRLLMETSTDQGAVKTARTGRTRPIHGSRSRAVTSPLMRTAPRRAAPGRGQARGLRHPRIAAVIGAARRRRVRKSAMRGKPPESNSPPIVCLITLGCDKNTVDSQRLLGLLIQAGFWVAERPEDSDLTLVNTCAFIEEARRETQEVLEQLADLKRRAGRPRRVAAVGCMVERLGTLGPTPTLPADARIGLADYPRIAEICRRLLEQADEDPCGAVAGFGVGTLPDEFHRAPRLLTGLPHVAALKIAEGCSNRCHYCAIPLIRGPQVSRPLEEIVAEAQQLEGSGVREILLIAQDTTSWGVDRCGERCLPRLLRALSAVAKSVRYRLLYAHPRHVTDELIATLAEDPRFLPYLDLPLQHISDRVLASMGRGMTAADIRRLVERIRTRWPEVVLRTSYIVGYPNEETCDFEELVAWVREGHFVYAGVFTYSREPGTRAAELGDRVSPEEKERRRDVLLKTQREVTRRLLRDRLGTTLEVIVDQPTAPRSAPVPGVKGVGRALWQAPEVDGVVYVRGTIWRRKPGDVIRGRVVQALDYDLVVEAPG